MSRVRLKKLAKDAAAAWTQTVFGTVFDDELVRRSVAEIGPRSTHRYCVQGLWRQKVLRLNPHATLPTGLGTIVSNYDNLHFGHRALQNLASPGCYYQNFAATITIGRGVYIAPNVGLVTANHDPSDLSAHTAGEPIEIGDGCWIGMNAVILPGVVLGPRTVVAAGAVVTRSFPAGAVVIAGVPAREVRSLDPVG